MAVYYLHLRLYDIAVPPSVFAWYLSEHLGLVMDMYVGYYSSEKRNMSVFEMNDPLDGVTDDDAANTNYSPDCAAV